uniref:Uncharacterized protein n=1 Tax=Rhizophora mucronata TaxID=61149 RepID=A0A2P2N0V5_RHIMU
MHLNVQVSGFHGFMVFKLFDMLLRSFLFLRFFPNIFINEDSL